MFVPLRVVKNDSGSEVMLTIFQTLVKSEKKFAEDVDMVERDLKILKKIMEEDEIGSTTERRKDDREI